MYKILKKWPLTSNVVVGVYGLAVVGEGGKPLTPGDVGGPRALHGAPELHCGRGTKPLCKQKTIKKH